MNREIWERVRLREAKRGNHLMSYDMKVEVEGKVGLFAWLALDSLASPLLPICTHTGVREVDVGQKRDAGGQVRAPHPHLTRVANRLPSRNVLLFCSRQAARDWVYARDGRASITNHSLGNMITEMRIVNQAHQMKRVLTMGGASCSWSSVVLYPCSPSFSPPLTRAQRWTRSSRASPCPRLCTTPRRRASPR